MQGRKVTIGKKVQRFSVPSKGRGGSGQTASEKNVFPNIPAGLLLGGISLTETSQQAGRDENRYREP